MSEPPPPYPRVPHLFATAGVNREDAVLTKAGARALLGSPVLVEEKLDGANVVIWINGHGAIEVAGRAGPNARDRSRQLGPLRQWALTRADAFRKLLGGGRVLYGEWLWFAHGVYYDGPPAWLIALDLFNGETGWLAPEERDAHCREVGLCVPPRLGAGLFEDTAALDALLGPARYGTDLAEGLIVRALRPAAAVPPVAKYVASGYRPRTNDDWRAGALRNALRSAASPRVTPLRR